jgi:hypothetical protein
MQPITDRDKKFTAALWKRMGDLYKHRWASQEGEAKNHDGALSENFKLWARKTAKLTDDEWKIGIDEVERRVEKASSQGGDTFPPTYAQFLGYCRPSKSPDGTRSQAYVKFMPVERLTDETQEAKNKAAGRRELDKLMGRVTSEECDE